MNSNELQIIEVPQGLVLDRRLSAKARLFWVISSMMPTASNAELMSAMCCGRHVLYCCKRELVETGYLEKVYENGCILRYRCVSWPQARPVQKPKAGHIRDPEPTASGGASFVDPLD